MTTWERFHHWLDGCRHDPIYYGDIEAPNYTITIHLTQCRVCHDVRVVDLHARRRSFRPLRHLYERRA